MYPFNSQLPQNSQLPRPLAMLYNAVELAMAYKMSQALRVAVELGIPDFLSLGPKPIDQLAILADADTSALYRILRALAGVGLFSECEPKVFALTQSGRILCQGPDSMRDLILWTVDPCQYHMYADLLGSTKTGRPACENLFGKPVFEYMAENPHVAARFNAAMTNICEVTCPALLEAYDFSVGRTLVDVGGGQGGFLFAVLRKCPEVRGIICDSEECFGTARGRIDQLGLQDRCALEAVNFFERVPLGGDIYVLKNILHDWEDDRCVKILENCHIAMSETGANATRLLIIETVLDLGVRRSITPWLDLDMLVLAGGKERRLSEFRELLEKAGFHLRHVLSTKSPFHIMEAIPA